MPHRTHVAIVLSSTNIRRLSVGMQHYTQGTRDYWLIDANRPLDELLDVVRQWHPAGLITQWDPGRAEALVELGYPTVVTTADVTLPGIGSVDVDDVAVGTTAARHLLDIGLRYFAFLGNGTPYSKQRLDGFRTELRSAQADCSTLTLNPTRRRQSVEYWRDADADLHEWMLALPKPVGLFAVHDPYGRIVAEVCRDNQIPVPEQVAIVSADNDELICGLTHPPLSSVSISWEKIGFETARIMEQMLATNEVPAAPVLIPPEGVVPRLSSDILAVESPRLQAALRTIRERACAGLTVKELLRNIPISRRTLEEHFQRHLHRSPRDEIIRVRLQQARALLSRTDLSMALIAERCGFGNAERLSVIFRQLEGCTPTSYRNRYRLR
ncbi:MAG TPA: substrate-binding domain-containing protein [Opitutaceae bacterium]